MRDWIGRTVKFLAGLALGIFDLAGLVSLVFELKRIEWFQRYPLLFLAGAASFFGIHVVFKKRPFLYVFAHEISHALASVLTEGRVHSIYVSGKGGNTKTDKSNLVILLFPYIFPFFAVMALLFFAALDWVGDVHKIKPYFYFAMGLALAHHLFFTVFFILQEQSDIKKAGTVFALGLIGGLNLCVFAAFFTYLFRSFSAARWLRRTFFYFLSLFAG